MKVGTSQPNNSSRSITNLRMTPVLTATTHDEVDNRPNRLQNDNDDNSDPEDQLFDFSADDKEAFNDVIGFSLNQHDLLHGYSHDESYNPSEMEAYGVYPEELTWSYDEVPAEGIHENYYCYDSLGPSLWHNVSNKFWAMLEACRVAGGMTYQLIK